MHRTWKIDIKKQLQKDKNDLYIIFRSPSVIVEKQKKNQKYELPNSDEIGESKISPYCRKAQYHFGWDWAPRIVTMGIWRPIELIGWSKIRFNNIKCNTILISNAKVIVKFIISLESDQSITGNLSLKTFSQKDLRLKLTPGMNRIEEEFTISDPQLWWPRPLGNPYLYEIEVNFSKNDKKLATITKKFGIRSINVVQEIDDIGKSFFFKVNNIPIFSKGSNLIPGDSFLPTMTPDRIRKTIDWALEANMNTVRIWGGGYYPDDDLYDYCDEKGILIWQDFMFACSMFPANPKFIENVREEAIQTIERLQIHPSIVLWCGNVEIDEAWHTWGWKEQYEEKNPSIAQEIWRNYCILFRELLPSIVAEHDPERFYWQSSPPFGYKDPKSFTIGDVHYWGVFHSKKPIEEYAKNIGRFVSEFGFQSFTSLSTIKSYTENTDLKMDSLVMKHHQRHPDGNDLILDYMEKYYGKPRNFESMLYLSQILQADAVCFAIECHRRARPYCMGSLYWQLNDCWPVSSWASVDYYGRRKALHFHLTKSFADVISSLYLDENGMLHTYILNDLPKDISIHLKIEIIDFIQGVIKTKIKSLSVSKLSSTKISSEPLEKFLQDLDPSKTLLRIQLTGNEILSQNTHFYFLKPKELQLLESIINFQIEEKNNQWNIVLSSNTFARGVYIEINKSPDGINDNFFDLIPNEPYTVIYIPDHQITYEQIQKNLTILHLQQALK